jgi:hypothetical protein
VLYLLLIALIALPFAGALLAFIVAQVPRVAGYAPLLQSGAMFITLLIAWIMRPAQFETVLGDWSPVSFTGTPLIIASNPEGMAIVIAVAAVMTLARLVHNRTTQPRQGAPSQALIAALLFGALVLTALAHSLVTLLVGIGLVDLFVAIHGVLHSRSPGRVLRDALFHLTSLAFLIVAAALYDASGNSLYLPLAHIPERLLPFIMAALALRFSLLPLRAASDLQYEGGWTDKASVIASLLLIARLPQLEAPELRAWFYGLALLTALSTLIIGSLTRNRASLQTSVEAGALAVALTAAVDWQAGIIVVATMAWLLGTTLVSQTASAYPTAARRIVQIARYIGAACLIGAPLTAGFIGRAGVAVLWSGRGLGGAVLIVGFALTQLLLTFCTLRLVLWREVWREVPDAPSADEPPAISGYVAAVVLIMLSLHVVLFGISPSLAGAPSLGEQLGRNGFIGWIVWLFPTLLGFAAWWYEARWVDYIVLARDSLVSLIGLTWWQYILGGALNRIARPLGSIFVFLESDGALLWAVIVILVVVLVSRPGGP